MSPLSFRGSVCWLGTPSPFLGCLPMPSVIDGWTRPSGSASYLQVPTTCPLPVASDTFSSVARRLGPVYILLRDSSSSSHVASLTPRVVAIITRSLITSGNRASVFDVTPPTRLSFFFSSLGKRLPCSDRFALFLLLFSFPSFPFDTGLAPWHHNADEWRPPAT